MTENFTKLRSETKPQIQEAQRILSRKNYFKKMQELKI